MDVWGGIGRGMRGSFSAMLRGVWYAREGSKILTFLFRPRLVCSSLLIRPSSWKRRSANFALKRSEKGLLGGNSCQDRRRRSLTDAVGQVKTTQSKQLLAVNNYIKRCSFEVRCGSVVSTLRQDSTRLPSAASLSNPTTPQSRQSACRLRVAKRPRD
jgi:hypothetical protein